MEHCTIIGIDDQGSALRQRGTDPGREGADNQPEEGLAQHICVQVSDFIDDIADVSPVTYWSGGYTYIYWVALEKRSQPAVYMFHAPCSHDQLHPLAMATDEISGI